MVIFLNCGWTSTPYCVANENRLIKVGAGFSILKPSDAASIAANGDTIEILAGTYRGDVAVWRQNNLTIRGIYGKARIEANGRNAEGKGIWVIKGDNTTIENIEFSGASVQDRNGAGIRQEGSGLFVRNCYFHDNENGILAGANPTSKIVIENTEFAHNGGGDGKTHNLYIGNVKSLTLRFCYSHHTQIGHNLKSRAQNNFILYNRLMDEKTGTSSYIIDLSNGGRAFVIGNIIQQGPNAENWHIISYGAEGLKYPENLLYIINNTMVNDRSSGVFIRVNQKSTPAIIINNIFYGKGDILNGPGQQLTNLIISESSLLGLSWDSSGFVNMSEFDYHLKSDSQAIDAGGDPGSYNGFRLLPVAEYLHPVSGRKRMVFKSIDIGAYEFIPLGN